MYKKILLPIDLAHESSWATAAPVAIMLAKAGKGELHVMTVIPDLGSSIVGSYLPEGFEEKAVRDAEARLKSFLEAHAPAGLTVKGHVVRGTIYQEILHAADTLGCDLIVMASHRPELQDYLIGPNASHVVRHAKQSVHVVRG